MTASSSNDGEFETSTTTCAPLRTSANPSPVSVLTPVLGAAATASCPSALSLVMSFDPIRPVPPITTIFILFPPSIFGRSFLPAECLFSPKSYAGTRHPSHEAIFFIGDIAFNHSHGAALFYDVGGRQQSCIPDGLQKIYLEFQRRERLAFIKV